MSGGTGRRLGGRDKDMLPVAGRPLLAYALDAVAGADRVVGVGPRRPVDRPVTFVREDPPGSGPLAGLAAGVRATTADLVVALACDMPLVTAPVVSRLVATAAAQPGRIRHDQRGALHDRRGDGAVLVDGDGRRQPLAAVYRRTSLVSVLDRIGDCSGRPMRALGDHLELVEVPDPVAALDLDTWDDLRRIEEHLTEERLTRKDGKSPHG